MYMYRYILFIVFHMMETKCKSNEMIKGFVHFSIIIFIAYFYF